MTTELITVRNLETGKVGRIRRDWFENPAINAGILVEVEPGSKSAIPELWKSKLDEPDPETPEPELLDEEED